VAHGPGCPALSQPVLEFWLVGVPFDDDAQMATIPTFLTLARRVLVTAALLVGVLAMAQVPANATPANAVPAAATLTAPEAVAASDGVTIQSLHYVCANTLWLRTGPGSNPLGLLYYGDAVDYQYSITGWSLVYAYRYGLYGWVQSGWLC
jgi:hypothetical protein